MMIKGVSFDGIHSFRDLGLNLKHVKIEVPKAKLKYLELEGADGVEDVTNALSDVTFFNNRKLTLTFVRVSDATWFEIVQPKLLNSIHGKVMKIILDDDATWYYEGRVSVDDADSDKVIDEIKVTCDCKPYKMSISERVRYYEVNGTAYGEIDYLGSKVVTPSIECQIADGNTLELVLNDVHYALGNGKNIVADFLIKNGINSFSFVGNGYVTLSYRMGVL